MSQKNWAQYFLATGKPENIQIGWSPGGEMSGRSSPVESWKRFEEMSSPGSPKSPKNILATSYAAAGKMRKRRARRSLTRKNRKTSRRTRRR